MTNTNPNPSLNPNLIANPAPSPNPNPFYRKSLGIKDHGTVLEKGIKQLNRVTIWVSLGLWLVLGLVLGLVPSNDLVLYSTDLSSSCVPSLVPVSYTHLTLPTNREV